MKGNTNGIQTDRIFSRSRGKTEFYAAAKELCEQKGVAFADNDALAEQFMDLYWDVDGVHLKPDFYQYWAKNMLIAALEAELG